MNEENALALIDRVCGMALLNRDDHIRVSQALEFIRQSLINNQVSNDN